MSSFSRDASPSKSLELELESTICGCQNQLAHWDWNGIPHKDLPKLCKQSLGIDFENRLVESQKIGK